VRIVFHHPAGPALAARLQAITDASLDIVICGHDDLLPALLPDMDVLWHVLTPATAGMIAAAPKLRLIQKIGVGVNTIDVDAAVHRKIAVCNLPGTNARAVAELTLLLMLAALRRLPRFDAAMRQGRGWRLDPGSQDGLGELAGRTVGLIGYGAVPRALAPVLIALGARVIYTGRSRQADALGPWRSLSELLVEADIVSLHVPLTAATESMIDASALARMRPGAILVNTARGGLVDQAALTAALQQRRLAAAGLDVFVHEPVDPADPLLQLPNVVLTPHIGWLTSETFERSFVLAVENCHRLVDGRPLLHRVA
jgi:phosphoglycerate dehydrogenase-like enzyme